MFAVDFFIDGADATILNLELRADAELFEEQLKAGTFHSWETPRRDVLFLPAGKSDSKLPSYFQGLNSSYADEFEENGVDPEARIESLSETRLVRPQAE